MTTYRFRTRPYRHQREALRFLLRNEWGGALLMEPRTGKTKVAVDWLSVLNQQGKIKKALIVCPNRVMMVWQLNLIKESPRRVHAQLWDAPARKRGIPGVDPPGYDLYVVIVNYDAFATPSRKRTKSGRVSKTAGRYLLQKALGKWLAGQLPEAAIVLDESHKIKSPSGKAANMLVLLGRRFAYRAILTGTPLTKANRTHDVYMQWKFLNPERFADLETSEDFKMRYGRWAQRNGWKKFKGPRNLRELQRRMAADSYIIRRDQCFDLPPREDIVEYVELTSSAKVYRQMAEEMVAELEDGSTAEAALKITQALRLSQITAGFVTNDEHVVTRLGFEKFDRLVEILEERWEQDLKIVVAARWRADLDLVEDYADRQRTPRFSVRGMMKRHESDQAIVDFQHHDGAAVMCVQPAAAALGIDLSSADMMVWYSHTPSWVNFTQTCDRIALSRTSTTFVHLVARHSVDEVILDTLAGDGDIHRAIMTHPEELVKGRRLDLDDHSRLRGIGSFQFTTKGKR